MKPFPAEAMSAHLAASAVRSSSSVVGGIHFRRLHTINECSNAGAEAYSPLIHMLQPEVRQGSIHAASKLRKLAGRHGRKRMMFEVIEHVVRERRLDRIADAARDRLARFAVMMRGPHGEERSRALTRQHREDVVAKEIEIEQ